ncbi:hypothetical protein RND81_13G137800 [Saponaria officinalis]|uniref:Uncharacterized protein n=1 Tax=Saponaria officinalis TaxID=3572 RepID=A0AAW1GXH3_SAPOF
MNTITTSTKTSNKTISLSFLCLFLISYALSSSSADEYNVTSQTSALRTVVLTLVAVSLGSICLVIVARTTMVVWITVLVVLAISGKPRRVLAHQGKKITFDVAMYLVKVMVIDRHQFITLVCAMVFSLMAMVRITRL